MAEEEPPCLLGDRSGLGRPPKPGLPPAVTESPEHVHTHPSPSQVPPTPTLGTCRSHMPTHHAGAGPPELLGGRSPATWAPPPSPDLSSDPNPRPSWSPRRLSLRLALHPPPRGHLLTRRPASGMGVKLGGDGGEHSPTHRRTQPLTAPRIGPPCSPGICGVDSYAQHLP